MKLTVEGLEKERDFYFGKLRDIELICQDNENGNPAVGRIIDILYATEVRKSRSVTTLTFEPPWGRITRYSVIYLFIYLKHQSGCLYELPVYKSYPLLFVPVPINSTVSKCFGSKLGSLAQLPASFPYTQQASALFLCYLLELVSPRLRWRRISGFLAVTCVVLQAELCCEMRGM